LNKGQQQAVVYDELYTPEYAVKPLVPYLHEIKDWLRLHEHFAHLRQHLPTFWECTGKGSTITKVLRSEGFRVFETHIDDGIDFLKDDPPFHYDIIISNPPFSQKNLFLKRAFELGKPFAFLLPLNTLTTEIRGKLFKKHGISVLVLDKRIDYTGKKKPWQNTSWFCSGILFEKLIFAELKKEANS
jgi:hypothetical protein